MILYNSFVYDLNNGEFKFVDRDELKIASNIDEAFKDSINGMKQLDYQEIKFNNLKMFVKYHNKSVSMRTIRFVIFEELETKTDVLDELIGV